MFFILFADSSPIRLHPDGDPTGILKTYFQRDVEFEFKPKSESSFIFLGYLDYKLFLIVLLEFIILLSFDLFETFIWLDNLFYNKRYDNEIF